MRDIEMSADMHVTYMKTFVYVNVGEINNSFPTAILASCTHTEHYNCECYILPNNSSTGYSTALRLWLVVYS